jgi:retron-type reverse transcriptase
MPTVSDRIAQMVVKSRLEPVVDALFPPDSYGYRPGKAAQEEDGHGTARGKGTPQGGVARPLLANLLLHYAFDRWMQRT